MLRSSGSPSPCLSVFFSPLGLRARQSSNESFFFFFSVSNLSIMDSCRIRARTGCILTRLFFAMKVRNVSSFDTKLMATIPAFLERSPDSFQPPSLDRMILLSVAKSRPRLPYKTRISFFRLQNFFSPEFVQPNSIRIKPVRTRSLRLSLQKNRTESWNIGRSKKIQKTSRRTNRKRIISKKNFR